MKEMQDSTAFSQAFTRALTAKKLDEQDEMMRYIINSLVFCVTAARCPEFAPHSRRLQSPDARIR